MSYVKEPQNIDLVVAPSVLTNETKSAISNAIANYKEAAKKADHSGMVNKGKRKMAVSKMPGH